MTIFSWKNNPVRAKYFGLSCKIIAHGRANSVLVEFEDGFKMVTSRRALRRWANTKQIADVCKRG